MTLILFIDKLIQEDLLSLFFFLIIVFLLIDRYNTRLHMEDLTRKLVKTEEKLKQLTEIFHLQLSPATSLGYGLTTFGLGFLFLGQFLLHMFKFFCEPANVEELVIIYKSLEFPKHKFYLLEQLKNGNWRAYLKELGDDEYIPN